MYAYYFQIIHYQYNFESISKCLLVTRGHRLGIVEADCGKRQREYREKGKVREDHNITAINPSGVDQPTLCTHCTYSWHIQLA